jgi:hypothetical protein
MDSQLTSFIILHLAKDSFSAANGRSAAGSQHIRKFADTAADI